MPQLKTSQRDHPSNIEIIREEKSLDTCFTNDEIFPIQILPQCPIRRGSGQILGCGFLGLNPLLSGPRNGFWSIFGHLIEFGLVAQLSKQPQNGFYKVNQDMGRKFKTARVGTPLHGIGSVKSTVLIRENPQFMWPA